MKRQNNIDLSYKKIILNKNKIRKKLIIFEQINYDNSLMC